MPHKYFIAFILPSILAMLLFIATPIVSFTVQSLYVEHPRVLVTSESIAKQQRPVTPCALRFQIFRVTAFNSCCQCRQWCGGATRCFKCCCLLFKFGAHHAGPQALVRRLAGGNLRFNALGLFKVAFNRQQHANRVVVGGAQHKWRTAFSQGHQQIVGVAQAMRVGDDGGNVVERNLPKFLALAIGVLHHQKAPVHEQVAPVVSHFNNAADHADQGLKPGSRSSPMGEMVTRRALAENKEPACL